MAATEGYPIEDEKNDWDGDALRPPFQPDKSPNGELCEQHCPDATQQGMLVEQKEPEQERRYKAKSIEPTPFGQTERQQLHQREQHGNDGSPPPCKLEELRTESPQQVGYAPQAFG